MIPDTPQALSLLRLYLLRAMYLFIATGLALTIWPGLIGHAGIAATPDTVVSALLGALAVLCLVGLRYPVRMIPILIFELIWKLLWVVSYALPAWLNASLDAYTEETFFACMIGVVLVPLVLPWRFIYKTYVTGRGDPWRSSGR